MTFRSYILWGRPLRSHKSCPYKSLQNPPAKTLDGDTLRWKLLDAVSTTNLESIARCLTDKKLNLAEIPRMQRRVISQPLSTFAEQTPRKQAIALAYLSGQHTMTAVATHFGVHYTTVSRIVANHERLNNIKM